MKKVNLNFFTVEETECFIAVIPPSIFVALGALVTAFDLITITSSLNDHNWSIALFGWYNSVAVLVYFNIITQALYYGGKWTGEENYNVGETRRNFCNERIQSGNLLPSERPISNGIIFVTWVVFFMLYLAMV